LFYPCSSAFISGRTIVTIVGIAFTRFTNAGLWISTFIFGPLLLQDTDPGTTTTRRAFCLSIHPVPVALDCKENQRLSCELHHLQVVTHSMKKTLQTPPPVLYWSFMTRPAGYFGYWFWYPTP
jgi:hypothetical protein